MAVRCRAPASVPGVPGVKGQVQRRGVERRRQIVDAAIDRFASTGFRGTGLAAVAEAAGVVPSAIVHHFGSKEGLLQAVMEERDARTSADLASPAAPGGIAGLRHLVDIAAAVERERRLAELFTVLQVESFDPTHPLHDYFVKRSRIVRRQLEAVVRAGVEAGELRSDVDVSSVASEALAFMEGAQQVWLLDPGRHSLVELYRGYFERLIDALSTSR
jgi:AcrR family transcriptional regulator